MTIKFLMENTCDEHETISTRGFEGNSMKKLIYNECERSK